MKFLELLATLRTPLLDKIFLAVTSLGGEMVFSYRNCVGVDGISGIVSYICRNCR